MPVYEYQCKKCGHTFEREHAIGEKKKYRCPDCSSQKTEKIISQVGVVFKGSGFYVTDNRKSSVGSKTTRTNGKKIKASGNGSDSTTSTESTDSSCTSCPASEN